MINQIHYIQAVRKLGGGWIVPGDGLSEFYTMVYQEFKSLNDIAYNPCLGNLKVIENTGDPEFDKLLGARILPKKSIQFRYDKSHPIDLMIYVYGYSIGGDSEGNMISRITLKQVVFLPTSIIDRNMSSLISELSPLHGSSQDPGYFRIELLSTENNVVTAEASNQTVFQSYVIPIRAK